jgi:hypothetical protein
MASIQQSIVLAAFISPYSTKVGPSHLHLYVEEVTEMTVGSEAGASITASGRLRTLRRWFALPVVA